MAAGGFLVAVRVKLYRVEVKRRDKENTPDYNQGRRSAANLKYIHMLS